MWVVMMFRRFFHLKNIVFVCVMVLSVLLATEGFSAPGSKSTSGKTQSKEHSKKGKEEKASKKTKREEDDGSEEAPLSKKQVVEQTSAELKDIFSEQLLIEALTADNDEKLQALRDTFKQSKKQKLQKSTLEFLQKEALKNPHAKWFLGVVCFYGYVSEDGSQVSPLFQEAVECIREAANQGSHHAQAALGFMYNFGITDAHNKKIIDVNIPEAVKWYELAVKADHDEAMHNLGRLLHRGVKNGDGQTWSVEPNPIRAKELWEQAVANGSSQAELGLLFHQGATDAQNRKIIDVNIPKAVKWYELAVKEGNILATRNLGIILHQGVKNGDGQTWIVKPDPLRAKELYEQMAEKGDTNGQFLLGLLFHKGVTDAQNRKILDVNIPNAVKWYELAVKAGHVTATHNLGIILYRGAKNGNGQTWIVEPNPIRAKELWEQAVAKGCIESQAELGRLFHRGATDAHNQKIIQPDFRKAFNYFYKSRECSLSRNELPIYFYLNSKTTPASTSPASTLQKVDSPIVQDIINFITAEERWKVNTRRMSEKAKDAFDSSSEPRETILGHFNRKLATLRNVSTMETAYKGREENLKNKQLLYEKGEKTLTTLTELLKDVLVNSLFTNIRSYEVIYHLKEQKKLPIFTSPQRLEEAIQEDEILLYEEPASHELFLTLRNANIKKVARFLQAM